MFSLLSVSDGINLQTLPVIGIFIILVLREIGNYINSDRKSFFSSSNINNNKQLMVEVLTIKNKVDNIEKLIEILYTWHDKEDADGVKIWYVRQSLESAIEKLTETLENQTDLIKEYPIIMSSIVDKITDLSREIHNRQEDH